MPVRTEWNGTGVNGVNGNGVDLMGIDGRENENGNGRPSILPTYLTHMYFYYAVLLIASLMLGSASTLLLLYTTVLCYAMLCCVVHLRTRRCVDMYISTLDSSPSLTYTLSKIFKSFS